MRAVRIIATIAGVFGSLVLGTACLNLFDSPNNSSFGRVEAGHPLDAGVAPRIDGPYISSAPDAWAPMNCSGLGNACDAGCAPAGECQVSWDLCVPMGQVASPAAPSAQTPYCIAGTCLTFSQASCLCKGAAGVELSACTFGPGAVAGLCGVEGTSCSDRPCCGGLKCVKDSPTSGTCYRSCNAASDCDDAGNGCCVDLKGTGDKECAPMSACASPCATQGASCDQNTHCCTGICVTSSPNTDFTGCRPSCITNGDCLSGCCEPFSNASGGFCVDARYCNCTKVGGDCSFGECCPGSTCGMLDGGGSTCLKNCGLASDCDSGCCSSYFPGTNYGICLPPCH